MLTYKFRKAKSARTSAVDFALLSSDEIRRAAVVRVSSVNIYHRGMPNTGGINDHRMGTVDRRLMCGTCGRDVKTCPGHVGCIELAVPCYHVGFIDTILKVLRSVCYMCSRLKLTDDDAAFGGTDELTGKHLFHHLYAVAKGRRRCPHCRGPQPSYVRVPGATIRTDWCVPDDDWASEEERRWCEGRVFTSMEAASILRHIPLDDCRRMGFAPEATHPKSMMVECLMVPPPIARPAIMASEGSRVRGRATHTMLKSQCAHCCIVWAATGSRAG
jgi:DNA-directed RNA polymerase II subunit RPB1